jgi:hypothetical protein
MEYAKGTTMTHKPEHAGTEMPELPDPFDYCYEWDGPYGSRKFSHAPHNGRRPDRSVPLFTADQLRTYAQECVKAALAAAEAEREGLAMMIRMMASSLKRHHPDSTLPARAMGLLREYGLQGSPLRASSSDAEIAARAGG